MQPKSQKTIVSNKDPMKEYSYTVFFEPQKEGGYNVVVHASPPLVIHSKRHAQWLKVLFAAI